MITFLLVFCVLCSSVPKNSYYSSHPIRKNIKDSEKKVMKVDAFDCAKTKGVDKTNSESVCFAISQLILDSFVHFGAFNAVTPELREKAIKEYTLGLKLGTNKKSSTIDQFVVSDYFLTGKFTFTNSDSFFINVNVGDQNGYIRAKSGGSTKLNTILTKDSEMKIIKKVSIEILQQLGYDLTTEEIALIESGFETNNLEASIANYSGEGQIEKIQTMLLISDQAKKSNLTPEVVKQATGVNMEEDALRQQIKDLRQQAKANFEKAVRLDPDYLRAKDNLRKLMALLPPTF
ncbi:MAG: hypothetical protein KBA66_20375 [Leptospiraceae bacterium]|nr:hypothetical protein [Leptospiraceae bacterium]